MEGNFAPSFLLKFLPIFVHISESIDMTKCSYLGIKGKIFSSRKTWVQVIILVKGDDVKGGTNVNTHHSQFTANTDINGLKPSFKS